MHLSDCNSERVRSATMGPAFHCNNNIRPPYTSVGQTNNGPPPAIFCLGATLALDPSCDFIFSAGIDAQKGQEGKTNGGRKGEREIVSRDCLLARPSGCRIQDGQSLLSCFILTLSLS